MVRAARLRSPQGAETWTVVGADGLPLDEVESYLHMLRARPCSVFTLKAYSGHLAHLFRWFEANGVDWDKAVFDDLADFMFCYRNGIAPLETRTGRARKNSSARGVAAAVREFYEHHRVENGMAFEDLRLTRERAHSNRTGFHFLAHVEARNPSVVNRLSEGLGDDLIEHRIIDGESDFALLLDACRSARDRLVLSAMYDLGLRAGQALGLRHGDLAVRQRLVTVERREDNVNRAVSKQPRTFVVKAPKRFFDLYRDYLLGEFTPLGFESDYVFVNLVREPLGAPMRYENLLQQVRSIGRRAGLRDDLHPHCLRHTHATLLAKAGWTAAEIAARLGQSHASSADHYIHLVAEDLAPRLEETQHLIWPDGAFDGSRV